MAGYSKRSLVEKLGIKQGFKVAFVDPTDDYRRTLGKLPEGVTVAHPERPPEIERELDLVHVFGRSRRDMESKIARLKRCLVPEGMLWVSWPKASSRVVTDLNENIIREIALKNGLVDVKVCAVDETWSGLKLVVRLKD
jgi:hypothetical protein